MNFSFEDLGLETFEHIKELGAGQTSRVFMVFDKTSRKHFAMKVAARTPQTGIPPSIIKEIGLLREINHPNIVRIHEILFTPRHICVLYELADCDLQNHICSRRGFSIRRIREMMHMIFRGLREAHGRRILHRDLKPSNILVRKTELGVHVMISDFGLSRPTNLPVEFLSEEVVSLWYRAPELLMGSRSYNEKIDIWSAGCVFAELLKGFPMFVGRSLTGQCEEILKVVDFKSREKDLASLSHLDGYGAFRKIGCRMTGGGLRFLCRGDEICLRLLTSCLELDPAKRPRACEALSHPFFAGEETEDFHLDTLFAPF